MTFKIEVNFPYLQWTKPLLNVQRLYYCNKNWMLKLKIDMCSTFLSNGSKYVMLKTYHRLRNLDEKCPFHKYGKYAAGWNILLPWSILLHKKGLGCRAGVVQWPSLAVVILTKFTRSYKYNFQFYPGNLSTQNFLSHDSISQSSLTLQELLHL